jgi:hypothetical protein
MWLSTDDGKILLNSAHIVRIEPHPEEGYYPVVTMSDGTESWLETLPQTGELIPNTNPNLLFLSAVRKGDEYLECLSPIVGWRVRSDEFDEPPGKGGCAVPVPIDGGYLVDQGVHVTVFDKATDTCISWAEEGPMSRADWLAMIRATDDYRQRAKDATQSSAAAAD